jgi:peptide/nickel transport system permease protein
MDMADPTDLQLSAPASEGEPAAEQPSAAPMLRGTAVRVAIIVLVLMVALAVFAPWIATQDPSFLDPAQRLKSPGWEHLMGTDALGRDVFSRVVYGARVSLAVGAGVALASVGVGLAIGVIAGYFRMADAIIMRVMDGLMAIPGILLAIGLVSLLGGGISTVIVAIAVPETPRVVRLVRSMIIAVRSEPYVEAAVSLGTPWPLLLVRHLIPNTLAALTVQGTFILASAMLTEAAMSFLGVGLPPEIPSWGSVMADGRTYFQLKPGLIYFAGSLLAITVLSVNIVGDAVRDALDPKLARRL